MWNTRILKENKSPPTMVEFFQNPTTLLNRKHPSWLMCLLVILFSRSLLACVFTHPACQGPSRPTCQYRRPARPPLLSTSSRVGEARQKSHSGCTVIASVYHEPEDFYYCRWMMGLASCRPGRAGSFQSGLKCRPHCTEASGRGTTNRMGGFGESVLK